MTGGSGVYLVHALGHERSYWAYWPTLANHEALHYPQAQGTLGEGSDAARAQVQSRYPDAVELSLTAAAATELYRRIKRAELPASVRAQIAAALEAQQRQMRNIFAEAGFRPQDLSQLRALKRRYRQLARQHHPDQGGDVRRFQQLRQLYELALRRLKTLDPPG
ncbi:MAG: hypothetical protein CVV27_05340 [Candidatus Melainabacteria bacterium HGW-Melainabacteria-1]|nr:MAG: hypothetical protein CVV27_05340 [Candidatus Melainabacteria bacterium HGW-Melainabacteria-1]